MVANLEAANALATFLAMLEEYGPLLKAEQYRANPPPYVRTKDRPDPRLAALHTAMLLEVEHAKALVSDVIDIIALGFRVGGDPFQVLFNSTDAVREVRTHVIRAMGIYQHRAPRGGLTPAPAPIVLNLAFITDPALREVLERNTAELRSALGAEAWTAAIILAGAIAEGVPYFALSSRQARAVAASLIVAADPRRNPNGQRIQGPIERWNLWAYIEVADHLGLLSRTTTPIAHGVLRDFRNMVHPCVQIRDNLRPSQVAAEASRLFIHALVTDVSAARP